MHTKQDKASVKTVSIVHVNNGTQSRAGKNLPFLKFIFVNLRWNDLNHCLSVAERPKCFAKYISNVDRV